MDNQSERMKKIADDHARLSFMLEAYFKLVQTGDHEKIHGNVLECCLKDANTLVESLKQIVYEQIES